MDLNTSKKNKSCPFCRILDYQDLIADSKFSFAILDKYPVSEGHVLIISKRHCRDYFSLSYEEQLDCWQLLSKVKDLIHSKLKPDGYNIGININEPAGQTINHVHIHLIPRYKGDMDDPRGGIRHCITGKGYY